MLLRFLRVERLRWDMTCLFYAVPYMKYCTFSESVVIRSHSFMIKAYIHCVIISRHPQAAKMHEELCKRVWFVFFCQLNVCSLASVKYFLRRWQILHLMVMSKSLKFFQ